MTAPTPEMIVAGQAAALAAGVALFSLELRSIYRAMAAVAPVEPSNAEVAAARAGSTLYEILCAAAEVRRREAAE